MSTELLKTLVTITMSIFESADEIELFQSLKFGSAALGFDVFALSCYKPRGPELISEPTLTTASDAFLSDYSRLRWFDGDVNVSKLLAGEGPYFWNVQRDRHTFHRKESESYSDFLEAAGMRTGLMIPLPSKRNTVSAMGMVSFSNKSFSQELSWAGTIVAHSAMAKVEMLGLCSEISADEAIALRLLSRPQREILNWIAEGKSNAAIALIMGLNERAVRYHVSQILQKLGVATRSQAAVIFGAGKIL
ncbi:LuxR C-terminal-related transcriptional regulator [Burkholderia pseudomallei]|uniref:helix-turn-helix transcriptional regulator n=1 Tax=Burkholderia pseudomallei TaxID=28450 RepID=UPI003F656FDC